MTQTITISRPDRHFHRSWVYWLLFFFQFAAIGMYFTYLNVYYRYAGLSGTEIGLMNMITSLVGVSGSILWGYLSDRLGKTRFLISLGAIGALLVAQIVPLVHTFGGFLGLGIASSLMNSAPGTLVDSTVLTMLGEKREDYGRFRVGGSIGYIIAALSAGYLFDLVSLRWMFPAYGIIMTCFAITALLLPNVTARREKVGLDNRVGILSLIRLPPWILFTICIFLAWIASNAGISFLGVSLSSMGANQSLIGLVVTVGAIAELPFMAFSGFFMRKFGAQRLIVVGLTLMVIRLSLLGTMKAPEWAIMINLLNGPAFALVWNSSVTYANRMAPAGYAGTAQGLLNSTMSLAGVVSSLLTGWLFDHVGATQLFIVMALICLTALLLFGLGNIYLNKRVKVLQK